MPALLKLKSGWSQEGRKKINIYQKEKPFESRK